MTTAEIQKPRQNIVTPAVLLGSNPLPVRRGSRKLVLSFILMVLLPLGLGCWYLWTAAADRYASRTAFSIRSNDVTAPLEIFGSITQLGTSSAMVDGEILYDYIQSQPMLRAVSEKVDLGTVYDRRPDDWIFALGENQPVEELQDHWDLMTDVAIDPSSGILTVEARAFTPEDAQSIATAVLDASVALVNELSETARRDSVRHAGFELAGAEERLREIRTELRAFRDIEQEVDPTQNAMAALSLVATLEEDRAQALVQLDQLASVLGPTAPRIQTLKRRLETLDTRIADERTRLGSGTSANVNGRRLADVVGDYEELLVDREFAEQAYTLALATYEQAQAEARRQSRYLAVHIHPTLSERPEYPRRWVWLIAIAFCVTCAWAIVSLTILNIAERR